VSYLRQAPAPAPAPSEHACVAAFDQELDYIFASLRRLGARGGEIEDLAQEVFIVLHKKWPSIDTTRPLRPYLFAVAFRVFCADRRRRRREIPSDSVEIEDHRDSPEVTLQRSQAAALLMSALDRIPPYRRAVVVMHDIDGVPVFDIARRLSMSLFGVYARLRKGRRELQAAFRRLSLAHAG
jgi:RNA polymerase sigma-70 factor, ECF subfamily